MSIIQISILGVVGVLMAVQLKQEKAEIGTYLCIVISLLIFWAIMDNLTFLVDTIKEIGNFINIENSYIVTLIKMLGITYIAEVERIEKYKDTNKYIVLFKAGTVKKINKVALGQKKGLAPQSPRYSSYQTIISAKSLDDLWG